jgi:hypothetical protein
VPKAQLVDARLPARPWRLARERPRAGQQAARKDVLLDEVGRPHVALEQVVADGDGLDAGLAARLELAVQQLEVAVPVLAAHGLEHLDRDDGVEGPSAMSR